MTRTVLLSVVVLAIAAVMLAAAEMTGLVTCSKCRHADGKAMNCATTCLRSGVPAMFYAQATQKFYKITNQDAVKAHFGARVAVTGKLDADSLTVITIKPAPATGK